MPFDYVLLLFGLFVVNVKCDFCAILSLKGSKFFKKKKEKKNKDAKQTAGLKKTFEFQLIW